MKAKEASGAAVIQGWKDRHEDRKMVHHAERAEDNAAASICLAESAIADAVLASYEALDARLAATRKMAA